MGRRALQLSFGQHLSDRVRCDVGYINEGHPRNNHRDGFSAACWWTNPVIADVRIEAGAGPYFSMNTTMPAGGTQINDKRLGLVASAAILYRIDGGGTHVRAQYNHVAMSGAPSSDAFLIGLGVDFDGGGPLSTDTGDATEVGLWAGATETTAGGSALGVGGQIEARRFVSAAIAYSVSAVSESKSADALNRKGLAVQAWWVRTVGENWRMSAGAGPLFARDRNLSGGQDKVLGLLTFEAARALAPQTRLSIRFNRLASGYDKDADQFMIGLSRRF